MMDSPSSLGTSCHVGPATETFCCDYAATTTSSEEGSAQTPSDPGFSNNADAMASAGGPVVRNPNSTGTHDAYTLLTHEALLQHNKNTAKDLQPESQDQLACHASLLQKLLAYGIHISESTIMDIARCTALVEPYYHHPQLNMHNNAHKDFQWYLYQMSIYEEFGDYTKLPEDFDWPTLWLQETEFQRSPYYNEILAGVGTQFFS